MRRPVRFLIALVVALALVAWAGLWLFWGGLVHALPGAFQVPRDLLMLFGFQLLATTTLIALLERVQ